ncbi:MAG: LptF/LptG family permease, partial [Nitrospiraceae bacterium]|nr:LptF/LptG family permease [Nitrospiraceae bacterium]
MTILDRYIGARTLATLIKTVVSLVLLFVLIDLLTHRREIIAKHEVPWQAVVRYYAVLVPRILFSYQVAAMSMLVSALLVLGAAAQRSEVTAALAGGISLRRFVRMPVCIALLLAVGLFFMQETIGVAANQEIERIDANYFSRSGHNKRAGVSWARLSGGWSCHIMKFNRVALTGENVFMHASHGEIVEQIQA